MQYGCMSTETGGIRLRKDHPTGVIFIDETGAISNDRIFAVGMVKGTVPSDLTRALQQLRDRRHWYSEFKFTAVTRDTLDLYKEFIDVALAATSLSVKVFLADRDSADPVVRFGDHWTAYNKMAEQLVLGSIAWQEIVTVLADNYSTPPHVRFEDELKANVNKRLNRLAVASVLRLDSRSSDALQLVDMFTSTLAHEFRVAAGLARPGTTKEKLAAHARAALGIISCRPDQGTPQSVLKLYEHDRWRAGIAGSPELR